MMLKQLTFPQAKKLIISIFFIIFIFLPQLLNAQSKKDSDCPTEIISDTAEFNDEKGLAIYKGNVIATQGSRKLYASVLKIFRGKDNKISKMIAYGKPARIKAHPNPEKPVGYGKALTIKYYPNQEKADLLDKAELKQNGDIVRGNYLTYFFETGLLLSNKTTKGRTTVILQPRG